MAKRWQALVLTTVMPPPQEKPPFDTDLYVILETIYARRKRKEMPVLRGTIVNKYPGLSTFQKDHDRHYSRHAEIVLVDYLISVGRPPTEIGISKMTCGLCGEYIRTINSREPRNRRKWLTSGSHGDIHFWLRDEMSRQGYAEVSVIGRIYDLIVELINEFTPRKSESDVVYPKEVSSGFSVEGDARRRAPDRRAERRDRHKPATAAQKSNKSTKGSNLKSPTRFSYIPTNVDNWHTRSIAQSAPPTQPCGSSRRSVPDLALSIGEVELVKIRDVMILLTPANPKCVIYAVDEMGLRFIDWYITDLQFNGSGEDLRCLREVGKALEKCATPRLECFVSVLLFMAGLTSGDHVGGRQCERT
jgi:OTT_1508-like deaminase